MLERGRLIRNLSAAPFGDRYTGLLRQSLRGDLVAERSHRLGARTQEQDPFTRQAIDKDRVFRDEAPAGPHRICTHLAQCGKYRIMIEIGRNRAAFGRQKHGAIGLSHKGGVAIRRCVERDDFETAAFALT